MTKDNNSDLAQNLAASLFLNEQFKNENIDEEIFSNQELVEEKNKLIASTRKETQYDSLSDYEVDLRNWIKSFPKSSNMCVELSISGIVRKIVDGQVDLENENLTPVAFIIQNCDPEILIQDSELLAKLALTGQRQSITNYLMDAFSRMSNSDRKANLIKLIQKLDPDL